VRLFDADGVLTTDIIMTEETHHVGTP